ncbi:MAG: tetratricopeptide repeat protein [Bryobacteraceae bacterium]
MLGPSPFVFSEDFSGSNIVAVLFMGSPARPAISAAATPPWRPVINACILAFALLLVLLIFAPPTTAQTEPTESKFDQLRQAVMSIQEQILNLQGMINRLTDQISAPRPQPETAAPVVNAFDWTQAQDAYTKGMEAEEASRMLDAVEDYSLAVRLDPNNDAAYFHRANCFLRVGNLAAALSDLNDSLKLQPNNGRAYEIRSQVLIALNRPADALLDEEETLRRDPNNPQLHLNKGNLLFNLGFPDAALQEFRTVAALDPKIPGIEKLIALANGKTGRESPPPPVIVVEPAPVAQATRVPPPAPAAPPPPETASGVSDRSNATVRLNGPVTATPVHVEPPPQPAHVEPPKPAPTGFPAMIEALSRTIEANPKDSIAYNSRGYAHLRLKQFQEAIADFTRAIELNPRYVNAYHNRSVARRLTGDMAGAEADARTAIQLTRR